MKGGFVKNSLLLKHVSDVDLILVYDDDPLIRNVKKRKIHHPLERYTKLKDRYCEIFSYILCYHRIICFRLPEVLNMRATSSKVAFKADTTLFFYFLQDYKQCFQLENRKPAVLTPKIRQNPLHFEHCTRIIFMAKIYLYSQEPVKEILKDISALVYKHMSSHIFQ